MPYEFEPKDLDRARSTRTHRTTNDEHSEAFEQWLNDSEEIRAREIGGETSGALYELAVDVLDGINVSPSEATALPIAYPDRTTPNVGLFLSAAYNLADEDVVVFDADLSVKPKRVGYRLPAEKILLLDEPIQSTMAVDAQGLIVNRTDIDRYFGYSSDGVFVNCGTCLTLGFDAARAMIDIGEVRGQSSETGERRGISIDGPARSPAQFVGSELTPELEVYLDELEPAFAGSVGTVEAYLADLDIPPADAIVDELTSRLPDND